jgi:hypothetical protein
MTELNFITINDMYGGDQNRFTHRMMRMGGCSTVCACHAAACLAHHNPERRGLSPFSELRVGEEDFHSFARDMFRYVFPGIRGMPSTKLFERAFGRYAASKDVHVEFHSLQGDASYAEAHAFLRENIDAGYTVQYLLLRHKAEEFSELEWHWFTLTGYEQRAGDLEVVYATFGKRFTAGLKGLWDTGNREKGGMIVVV